VEKKLEQPKFSLKDLHFEFDLSKADYQIDALQNELLLTYLRADPRFRRAFSKNYTNIFLKFLQDKARLKEPVHISCLGQTRSGKSYTMIGLATYQMACYGKRFGIDNICANAFEFLEKLKSMPEEQLTNSCFLIDEEKQSVYGVGSIAKKMKLTDVQNIIAINNISTIMLNPITWANKEAMYGLRTFGRCFKTKTCRMMLYNLQEKGKGGELPMGNIYMPIFPAFLPKTYADELEKAYLDKKKEWVRGEMRGEGDVLYEIKRKSAESFCRDRKFLDLKKKNERIAYISYRLGSEWTKGECEEIFQLTKLIQAGALETE
jgi:hypothetical protein